ncbi:uncharacterized protein LOC117316436 [Pecten maximus]|uniref:uncharacterized protein LOC117316436 n=1 Tax=Pecten maximus TaxID=6579 RepID=UPI00145886A7|nr:uncharacterized protein LOC117316436 [Pecten maximus]
MAMAGVEFCRGEQEMDENYVMQLQALIRGYLTRRNLQLVRDEYEQIFSEIEGNEKIFVCWPLHSLCLPKTQKDRPTKKVSHRSLVLDNQTQVEKDVCEPGEAVSPVTQDNFDLYVQKEKIQEKCTAETQTSFIEDFNLKLSLGSSLISQKTDTGDDQDHRMQVQDNMYTSSREDSFTDHSGTDEVPDIVQQTFDDSSMKNMHPSCAYDEKSSLPQKSPDSSGGFEHSAKTSGSRSSSGRSQIKSSMISSEKTEVSRSKRSGADSDRSHTSSIKSNEKSHRSDVGSCRSMEKDDRSEVKSDRSNVSSSRSSIRSDRLEIKSNRSNVSSGRLNVKSGQSDRSKLRADMSTGSKSVGHPHIDEREQSPESMTPRRYMRESSVLTNATSVWDSFSSTTGYTPSTKLETITDDPDSLMEMRKNVAMELLWVQQAISSRKNYLKIKGQMKIPMSSI